MKKIDLEARVKTIRVPQRGDDYWEAFPQQVLGELRAAPVERPWSRSFVPGFLWSGRLALAALALTFCLCQTSLPAAISHALRQDEKEFCRSVERFHDNLGRLMQDEHGLHKLIEDHS